MALDPNAAFTYTNGAAFPDNKAVNASGPTELDGTEFVKLMVDNFMFGRQQALLNYADITPNGLSEEDGDSQEIEAMQRSFGAPGEAVDWYGDADPSASGLRILLLEGQGILVADYPELTAAVYVGDADNPTAPAFYRADDAAGTIRNIAGIYLILPDATGEYPRFSSKDCFAARIANNGTATITSQTGDFIASVSRTALGKVLVTWKTSLLGVAPAVLPKIDAYSSDLIIANNPSATSVEIWIFNLSATFADRDFAISVTKQGTDYKPYADDFIRGGIRY